MAEKEPVSRDADALRADLQTEYYAMLDVVTGFDQRFLTVKGWSVTLSLAGIGLGFQQGHYALFALAAGTALAFWLIDVTMKTHQVRYYARMRDIEVAAFHLNRVRLEGLGDVSAPRIDASWEAASRPPAEPSASSSAGQERQGQPAAAPRRRSPQEMRRVLRLAFWMPQVLLPHALAVLVGAALFVAASSGAGGLDHLAP